MSAQQSWAAWLLDSYASSVSPVMESGPFRKEDDLSSSPNDSPDSTLSRPSTSRSMASSASPESPYGPYARTGRGGAGNFIWQSDINNPPKDLEAQQQSSLSERRKAAAKLEHIDTDAAVKGRKMLSAHTHTGRGGAGNYTQASEAQTSRSPNLAVSPRATQMPSVGRGGAGNFAAAAEANSKVESEQEQEERLAAERRREKIEEQVQNMLQAPPGAWLGGRRRSVHFTEDE